MVRYQVVGTLQSFIANRQNDVRRIVEGSSLDAVTKHQLHTINVRQAWFETRAMFASDGAVIPVATQRLARRIMKHVLSQHRRPSFKRCNMVVDQRQAVVGRAMTARTFDYWLRLGTLDGKVNLPLCTYPYHENRPGKRATTVQVNTDRDGHLFAGRVTDVTEPFKASRRGYQPLRDELAIDLALRADCVVGLSTLVATDDGDLMGEDFLAHLAKLDRRIDGIARVRQRAGLKTRSRRYDKQVRKLRGYVETEINRVLEHLVRLKRPARLIVEKLDFQHPELSKRMNRLVKRSGRKVFRQKLQDLQERFGIEVIEVDPAYTSQRCSSCGYTDRSNNPARAAFRCGRCGHTCHADVDAARVVRGRRSGPGSTAQGGPRKRVPAVSYRSGRGSSGRIADARGRQAGASRRSSPRGWRGKPPRIGFHPPGSAGSALPDAAAQHVDAVSSRPSRRSRPATVTSGSRRSERTRGRDATESRSPHRKSVDRPPCQHMPLAYTGRFCGKACAESGQDLCRVSTCRNIDHSLCSGVCVLEIVRLSDAFAGLLGRLEQDGDYWLLQAIESRLTQLTRQPPAPEAALQRAAAREGHLIWVTSALSPNMLVCMVMIDRTAGEFQPLDGRIFTPQGGRNARDLEAELRDQLPDALRAA